MYQTITNKTYKQYEEKSSFSQNMFVSFIKSYFDTNTL